MLSLETELPAFDLENVNSKTCRDNSTINLRSSDLNDKPILLMIICAHCPFVKHIEHSISDLDNDYRNQIQIIAISSNSLITHPQDGPLNLSNQAKNNDWAFPYLIDSDQYLAKALKAACTPDFFLFASDELGKQRLKYRGQLDSSTPGNDLPSDGKDLRLAVESVLDNRKIDWDQKPSIGCNIKWHPGEEPSWFA